jgi:hypothetical protein
MNPCRLVLAFVLLAAARVGAQEPQQIRLTIGDGRATQWIQFDRAGETVTRSPGLERLGGASGTMYVAEGAPVHITAALAGGAVPSGHRIRIYWQGYPKYEDICIATSGTQCVVDRRLHTLAQGPNGPIVCAGLEYLSGGTNRGLGVVCIDLSMGKAPAASGGVPQSIRLNVSDGRATQWIQFDRAGETVTRSPGLERLGSGSGTMYVAEGAPLHISAALVGGVVPPGHRIRIYWQGYPKYEDVCAATSGAQCVVDRRLHTLAQGPNGPIVCAGLEYLSGGTNQGLGVVCIDLHMGH